MPWGKTQHTGARPSPGVRKHVFRRVLVRSRDPGKGTSREVTGGGRTRSRTGLEGCGTED